MPCFPVSAPPTLDTVTATHAILPILGINKSDYKVKGYLILCFLDAYPIHS